MTENQINKNSPEYKEGYSNGLFVGGFAGLVVAALVGTIANYSHSIKHGSSATSNLEKALASPEVVKAAKELKEEKEDLDTLLEKIRYEQNLDEETSNTLDDCYKPYNEALVSCKVRYVDNMVSYVHKVFEDYPEEMARFDKCIAKYPDKKVLFEMFREGKCTGINFEQLFKADEKYKHERDNIDNRIDKCIKPFYETYKQCKDKTLEVGFKRYQQQKNMKAPGSR